MDQQPDQTPPAPGPKPFSGAELKDFDERWKRGEFDVCMPSFEMTDRVNRLLTTALWLARAVVVTGEEKNAVLDALAVQERFFCATVATYGRAGKCWLRKEILDNTPAEAQLVIKDAPEGGVTIEATVPMKTLRKMKAAAVGRLPVPPILGPDGNPFPVPT